MSLTVCRGPAVHEVYRKSDGEHYCFYCRKRQEFCLVMSDSIEPSYWGPTICIECGKCHTTDSDLFPGGSREWDL